MASNLKNLSDFSYTEIPDGNSKRVGIAVAEWNHEITGALLNGALNTLISHGVKEEDILVVRVPGTFELTFAAKRLIERRRFGRLDSVIVLGCVIQGDTRHFDFICNGVTQGITELNVKCDIPVIFGVLTTDNLEQAKDRAGGRLGNKGDEAAATALKMMQLNHDLTVMN
jgi:6,7-dimethyl-8-ribityllumazine synthase